MKKIAIDARPLSSKLTGIGRYLYNLLNTILIIDTENKYFLYSTNSIIYDFSMYSNVEKRTIKTNNKMSELLFSQLIFPYWCKKDSIDTYWSPRHHLPLILKIPKNMNRVVTIHDIVWLKYPKTMSKGGYIAEKILFKPSVKIADHILVLSKFTQNEMIKSLDIEKGKISITGTGCFTSPNINEDITFDINKKFFLFVGTLEPRKNLKNILGAFKILTKRHNNIQLMIVGKDGWGNVKIDDLINRYRLTKNEVKQLGFISDEYLTYLYKNCEALLMPSLYEGFGLPALEALSHGKKVLVTENSAIAEMEGDNIFISKTNSNSIYQYLEIILKSYPKEIYKVETDWKYSAYKTLDVLLAEQETK